MSNNKKKKKKEKLLKELYELNPDLEDEYDMRNSVDTLEEAIKEEKQSQGDKEEKKEESGDPEPEQDLKSFYFPDAGKTVKAKNTKEAKKKL